MQKVKRLIRYDWPLHFIIMFTNWLPDNVFFIRLRGKLVRPFFKKCGSKFGLGRNVTFYNPSNVEIGDNVYIAYGCWFLGAGKIEIGDEVMFGPYVVVSPSNYSKVHGSFRFGPSETGNVKFGRGSWIGAHATVLLGSSIGDGVLIGANSIVNKKTENHSLYAGVPFKFIKKV